MIQSHCIVMILWLRFVSHLSVSTKFDECLFDIKFSSKILEKLLIFICFEFIYLTKYCYLKKSGLFIMI